MNPILINTGDDIRAEITLTKDGSTFAISSQALVKAALLSVDHSTKYTKTSIVQSSTSSGADWANSLVVVEIPAEATEDIKYQGFACLGVKVKDNGITNTWYLPARIMIGQV